MLHPEQLQQLAEEIEQQADGKPSMPKEIYGEGILQKLETVFDGTQYNAIAVSAESITPLTQLPEF